MPSNQEEKGHSLGMALLGDEVLAFACEDQAGGLLRADQGGPVGLVHAPQPIEWDLAPVLWLLAPIVVCATDTVQVDWNPTLELQCYPREASGDREKPVLPLDGTFLGPSWHMPYKVRLHNDRRSSGVSHA